MMPKIKATNAPRKYWAAATASIGCELRDDQLEGWATRVRA